MGFEPEWYRFFWLCPPMCYPADEQTKIEPQLTSASDMSQTNTDSSEDQM
jgi:hypothetical protein